MQYIAGLFIRHYSASLTNASCGTLSFSQKLGWVLQDFGLFLQDFWFSFARFWLSFAEIWLSYCKFGWVLRNFVEFWLFFWLSHTVWCIWSLKENHLVLCSRFWRMVSTYACIRRKNNGRKSSYKVFTFFISLIVTFHKYIRLYGCSTYQNKVLFFYLLSRRPKLQYSSHGRHPIFLVVLPKFTLWGFFRWSVLCTKSMSQN